MSSSAEDRRRVRDAGSSAITERLRDAWQAIAAAERARGQASDNDGGVAQKIYELALDNFRMAQIDAFTVALGYVPLMWEQLEDMSSRLVAMHREIVVMQSDVASLKGGPRTDETP
jgi:hypothetical protein